MKGLKIGKKMLILGGLILMIVLSDVISAQQLQQNDANKSWNTFWAKFNTAVKTKNRKSVIALTSKKFFSPSGETISQLLNQRDMWQLLRNSIKTGTKPHTCRKLPCRITRNQIVESSLLFVFENNRWSFIGQIGE